MNNDQGEDDDAGLLDDAAVQGRTVELDGRGDLGIGQDLWILSLHILHAGVHEKCWQYARLAAERLLLERTAQRETLEFTLPPSMATVARSRLRRSVRGPSQVSHPEGQFDRFREVHFLLADGTRVQDITTVHQVPGPQRYLVRVEDRPDPEALAPVGHGIGESITTAQLVEALLTALG